MSSFLSQFTLPLLYCHLIFHTFFFFFCFFHFLPILSPCLPPSLSLSFSSLLFISLLFAWWWWWYVRLLPVVNTFWKVSVISISLCADVWSQYGCHMDCIWMHVPPGASTSSDLTSIECRGVCYGSLKHCITAERRHITIKLFLLNFYYLFLFLFMFLEPWVGSCLWYFTVREGESLQSSGFVNFHRLASTPKQHYL